MSSKKAPWFIRLAGREDAAAISDLITPLAEKQIAHEFSPEGARRLLESVTPKAIETYLEAGYRYHVAQCDRRLVGAVGVRDNEHLYHLFVAEDHQRRGLARELWNVARKACLQAGHSGEFTVNSSRFALDVYRSFGFTESGPPENDGGVICFPMRCPNSTNTES